MTLIGQYQPSQFMAYDIKIVPREIKLAFIDATLRSWLVGVLYSGSCW